MSIFAPTTSSVTSEDFASLFTKYVYTRQGIPHTLTIDCSTQFTWQFWSPLAKLLNLESNSLTAYHPQTDGQTKIVNQWLDQYIRSYCDHTQDDWNSLLPIAELCHNNTPHQSTGVSPMRALTRSDPKTFFTKVIDVNSNTGSSDANNWHNKISELQDFDCGRSRISCPVL